MFKLINDEATTWCAKEEGDSDLKKKKKKTSTAISQLRVSMRLTSHECCLFFIERSTRSKLIAPKLQRLYINCLSNHVDDNAIMPYGGGSSNFRFA